MGMCFALCASFHFHYLLSLSGLAPANAVIQLKASDHHHSDANAIAGTRNKISNNKQTLHNLTSNQAFQFFFILLS